MCLIIFTATPGYVVNQPGNAMAFCSIACYTGKKTSVESKRKEGKKLNTFYSGQKHQRGLQDPARASLVHKASWMQQQMGQ